MLLPSGGLEFAAACLHSSCILSKAIKAWFKNENQSYEVLKGYWMYQALYPKLPSAMLFSDQIIWLTLA